MKSYIQSNSLIKKLPDSLRGELITYLNNQKGTTQLEWNGERFVHDGKLTPREKVFEFASQVANQFRLPNDIKNYLDKASSARFRQYGFKRAVTFIQKRSEAAFAALAVLPEPWWKLDTEFKRARLATELCGRAMMRLQICVADGKSPLETIADINEFVGAALWMPQFTPGAADSENRQYSILARLMDESVWKRAIERQTIAAFENARRGAGMVSPHVSPYASYSACEWLKVRQDRQREWLELMAIEAETGETVDMVAVHESSVAHPVNRRHELMTRIAGCQEYAEANNHVAIFITMTAPSRFHRLKQHGKYWSENDKWNGESPADAHEWLNLSWSRFRAYCDRKGVIYYGLRVVEPHQDGSPHWHGVFFVPFEQTQAFTDALKHYQIQRDNAELFFDDGKPKTKAQKARFDYKVLDGSQGAVAYIAKYISKNVDGYGLDGLTDLETKKALLQDTVKNVTAWSRSFAFRQFQFQKTPSVTVWRELRRIEDKQEYCLFEKARRAADMGFYSAFFDYMGGHRLRQSERPIKPMKEVIENKYGEHTTKVIGLEGCGLSVVTHDIQWKLVKKPSALQEASQGGGSLRPWSSGNNCTEPESAAVRPTRQQHIIDTFFLNMELNGGGTPEWEEFWCGSP
ncbi:hypothetical protein CSW98_14050 [Vibrio sp. HA2012]|uniref:replication endonuclease n=1 Tax=Vibrio sp. HA2012 TaxID=1971595 RepID=UPI000C2CB320|nr:replication endonuclease [Vibrio sp. HA2012]PJC85695.1 hypothetical protein CSW98_14050 [Vibrio sp. HA2012]